MWRLLSRRHCRVHDGRLGQNRELILARRKQLGSPLFADFIGRITTGGVIVTSCNLQFLIGGKRPANLLECLRRDDEVIAHTFFALNSACVSHPPPFWWLFPWTLTVPSSVAPVGAYATATGLELGGSAAHRPRASRSLIRRSR